MTPRQALIGDAERDVLIRLALGTAGADFDVRYEHRFVHRTTGETTVRFDARVHGDLADWDTECRTVIETNWSRH